MRGLCDTGRLYSTTCHYHPNLELNADKLYHMGSNGLFIDQIRMIVTNLL
jgi:hypothetical protein